MLYMLTFTINIPAMLAYIPYMDPMGISMVTMALRFTTSFTAEKSIESI